MLGTVIGSLHVFTCKQNLHVFTFTCILYIRKCKFKVDTDF